MSNTQLSNDTATKASGAAAVPLRPEVVVMPVADVDRANSDPDGNRWLLQEITERLPGRV